MPIDSTPDHVAAVVPSIDDALPRWQDALGGAVQWRFHTPSVFRGAALRFRGGTWLELLQPSERDDRPREAGGPSGFVEAFLDRFGASVHHVTLKVPDLPAALDVLATAGLDAVDVSLDDPHWQEAFLRPSQVGGLVVQVASTDWSPEQFAAANGGPMADPADDGAVLLGPRLTHPSPQEAAATWRVLGAEAQGDDDRVLVTWPGNPFEVEVVAGERASAAGLRFTGTGPRPVDPAAGPPVLVD